MCACCCCPWQVYEVAADVCMRAGDYPEALKCIAQLHGLIYPLLASQLASGSGSGTNGGCHDGSQPNGARCSSGSGGGASSQGRSAAVWKAADGGVDGGGDSIPGASDADDSAVRAALARPEFRRWPEVAAAQALYFRCCTPAALAAAGTSSGAAAHAFDTLSTLCRLPPTLLSTPEVQLALAALSSLDAGDFVRFFRIRAATPPLARRVMAAQAGRQRERALLCMAAAYRNVAVEAAVSMLALEATARAPAVHVLLAYIKTLADR